MNPLSVIDFRCMSLSDSSPGVDIFPPSGASCSSALERLCAASCSDSFLLRPLPLPTGRPSTSATVSNSAVVRRALLPHDRVDDDLAALREPLLELALEVELVRDRELDLGRERLRHRRRRALEAELEKAGADRRLERLRQHALGRDQGLRPAAGPSGATARIRSGTPSARATSTQARLLTTWARILVSRPAV